MQPPERSSGRPKFGNEFQKHFLFDDDYLNMNHGMLQIHMPFALCSFMIPNEAMAPPRDQESRGMKHTATGSVFDGSPMKPFRNSSFCIAVSSGRLYSTWLHYRRTICWYHVR